MRFTSLVHSVEIGSKIGGFGASILVDQCLDTIDVHCRQTYDTRLRIQRRFEKQRHCDSLRVLVMCCFIIEDVVEGHDDSEERLMMHVRLSEVVRCCGFRGV